MQAVKKVAMVIVMENDLEAAVGFYKKLGLQLIFHVKDRWAEFKINDLQIGLCPTDEVVKYHRTGIVFEVPNLAEFYESSKQELNFLDKPTEAAHGIMASIQDPSGNILDLYQPTPEKLKELAEQMEKDGCCGDAALEDECSVSQKQSGGCC